MSKFSMHISKITGCEHKADDNSGKMGILSFLEPKFDRREVNAQNLLIPFDSITCRNPACEN